MPMNLDPEHVCTIVLETMPREQYLRIQLCKMLIGQHSFQVILHAHVSYRIGIVTETESTSNHL